MKKMIENIGKWKETSGSQIHLNNIVNQYTLPKEIAYVQMLFKPYKNANDISHRNKPHILNIESQKL